MKWRPHTETPATDEPMSALVAVRDEQGDFLLGIKLWQKGRWIDEDDARPLTHPEFCGSQKAKSVATMPRIKGRRRG